MCVRERTGSVRPSVTVAPFGVRTRSLVGASKLQRSLFLGLVRTTGLNHFYEVRRDEPGSSEMSPVESGVLSDRDDVMVGLEYGGRRTHGGAAEKRDPAGRRLRLSKLHSGDRHDEARAARDLRQGLLGVDAIERLVDVSPSQL